MRRLILIAFIESLPTILVERGIYFYTDERLGFSAVENLWLALVLGVAYVAGALTSHPIAVRLGEKRLLALVVGGSVVMHAVMAVAPTLPVLVGAGLVLYWLTGAKWPIIESYISAGQSAHETARSIGKFNISWALAAPPAMLLAGPLIELHAAALFAAGGALNLVTLALLRPLDARPAHLPDDHPERLPPAVLERYRALMRSGRWSMFASYTLLFLLNPLMPEIFRSMGFGVLLAPALAGLVEATRVLAFIALQRTHAWHGRAGLLAWSAAALPIGFLMVLLGAAPPELVPGQRLATVLAGEALFGLAAGMVYYAALYYAMIVGNASVESGGAHEGLIGAGFALGPAIGLAALALSAPLGGETAGKLAGCGPVLVLCAAAALWPLRRTWHPPPG